MCSLFDATEHLELKGSYSMYKKNHNQNFNIVSNKNKCTYFNFYFII